MNIVFYLVSRRYLPLARILLVDDDKDHLTLFKLVLEDGGYSVDAYNDPHTALSKFKKCSEGRLK